MGVYKLVKCKIEENKQLKVAWLITKNDIPYIDANQWLNSYNERKLSTAKEYGSKLVVFFNYLEQIDKKYEFVTKKDIHNFIFYLMAGRNLECTVITMDSNVGLMTIKKYITVIKMFYKKMSEMSDELFILNTSSKKRSGKKFNYMYGQIWNISYDDFITNIVLRCKNRREHIKWYTEQEKKALLSATNTLRDRAMIALTLEGLRIDEVLSIKLHQCNIEERVVKPSRSKGREDEEEIRVIAIKDETARILNNYINTERVDAEFNSQKISEYVFINLIKGKYQGEPMKYSTAIDVIKRVAKRCGMNPKTIRTHSGRSTRVMEYLEHQAQHPEDNITDEIIRITFGWRRIESLDAYRDRQNLVIAKCAAKKINRNRGKELNE